MDGSNFKCEFQYLFNKISGIFNKSIFFLSGMVLPQRVVLSIILFLGIVVSYTMRACLSIAITEMVEPVNNSPKGNDSLICPTDSAVIESATIMKAARATRYNWSQEEQGFILSAFFIGYVVSHIPGGLLAEKFGGKCTLTMSILILTICNGVTPPVLEYGKFITPIKCCALGVFFKFM